MIALAYGSPEDFSFWDYLTYYAAQSHLQVIATICLLFTLAIMYRIDQTRWRKDMIAIQDEMRVVQQNLKDIEAGKCR